MSSVPPFNTAAIQTVTPPAPAANTRVAPIAQANSQQTQSSTLRSSTSADSRSQGKEPVSDADLSSAVEQLNQRMQAWSTQLRFEVDQDAHRVVVSVIDAHTGDVVKTIPSEAVLHAAKLIGEWVKNQDASGALFSAQA